MPAFCYDPIGSAVSQHSGPFLRVTRGKTTTAAGLTVRPGAAALVAEHLADVRSALERVPLDAVHQVVSIILAAHQRDSHVYILGNGGSASTASHFACDLSKATIVEGKARLRVTSLNDNVALLTAWANDASYERVFAEQLSNLLSAGDVVIAISASGNSPNVLAAMTAARERGAVTVGLVGHDGGQLLKLVDQDVHVAHESYSVVEDCHLVLEHAITGCVRSELSG